MAFNALSFIWNPTEEAKVNRSLSVYVGEFFCKDTSLKEEGTQQVEDFKEVARKGRKGRWWQVREWWQRDWKNPRNVFSPEAPVTNSRSELRWLIHVAQGLRGGATKLVAGGGAGRENSQKNVRTGRPKAEF